MLQLSVQALKLQLTSAAVMSLCAAMERVFLCLNAVTGLNITVLMALTSSTAVRYFQLTHLLWEILQYIGYMGSLEHYGLQKCF